ncbi:MAG: response regulator [Lachnospiraceae bacterium]|nr:response regulator [Lachnospiraceae bacterium]
MLILAIDDEPKMLRLLHKAIEEAAPDAQIMDFPLGSAALAAIKKEKLLPSVIFTDIQMPKPDGLALAVELKKLVPDAKIVFVTGYDEYAVDAYRLHASGYVMKPVDAGRIREELSNALAFMPDESGKLTVRCFGGFEVFWQGEPLGFSRRKTKELLAWLVDRRGSSAGAEEAVAALYEDTSMDELKAAKQNLRNLINDLKSTLHGIGMDDILIRRGSTLAIRPERLDCDYYRMLEGDMSAVNAFRGEYMEQYSWAEITKAGLHFEAFRNKKD